jgi:hypothetical protein
LKRFGHYFNFCMKPNMIEAVKALAHENDTTPSEVLRELVSLGLKAKGIDLKIKQRAAVA